MKKEFDEAKIREALDLINEAAADNGERLLEMVSDRYESLKDFVNKKQGRLGALYNAGRDKARVAAVRVDEHVHQKPWAYIGGGVAIGLLAGFLLARRND